MRCYWFVKRVMKVDAVITVPAYFNDSQRQATKDAGHVAGLNVLQIINEPIAATIAYGLDMKDDITCEINVLIFDLGGGTFDVSLVTIDEEGKIEVKAVAGNTHLGGQDFDNEMLDHFIKEFNRKRKVNINENLKAVGRLRVACEKAKRALSSTIETAIEIDGLHQGIDFSTRITRAKFEHLNADFFSKCIETVESCLKDAKMDKTDVDEVEISKRIHVDEAVAYGAAVLAAKLRGETSQKVKNLVFVDVTPLSLGVEKYDGSMCVLIPRNTSIPAKMGNIFHTVEDNQSIVNFPVYQGERLRGKDNNWLGSFQVAVLLEPRGQSTVNVIFDIDANGILTCSGEEVTTGLKKKMRVTHDKGRLSKEEIDRMLKDAEMYRLLDQEYKKKVSARNALEDYIYNVKRNIKTIGSTSKKKIHKKDMKKMENAIEAATLCLDRMELVDVNEYEKTLNQLENSSVLGFRTKPAYQGPERNPNLSLFLPNSFFSQIEPPCPKKGIWGEIERIDPKPRKCLSDIRVYTKIKSKQKLFQFLNAQNQKYHPIKREIL
ncbi:Heat shock protein 70, conserved site-containing protein [Cynara cardunculus var. scolymus]|uniref:Heat shock protein 70, conserved site-containing protein n=1 Tax=Cynara cardunculus var. scolymus TaxID=59895 RepID=A0A103Y682_CYNCS|nr:Heat shock protein 70, conserved site-containing protein [Cynara cardunculus var. scolymus]